MKLKIIAVWFSGLLLLLNIAPSVTYGEVPQLINYQGYVTDSDGNPLEGVYNVKFSIYNVEEGGASLWTETQDIDINKGVFNVLLGSLVSFPDDLFASKTRYLGIKVGSDPEMYPRQRIASAPYSMNSDRLGGQTLEAVIPSGIIAIFTSSCPEGWSRFSAFDNRFLRGAVSFGGEGGTVIHSHTVSHSHTISSHNHQVYSHTHELNGDYDCTGGDSWCTDKWYVKQTPSGPTTSTTYTTPNSGTISSSNPTTSNAQNLPPYIDVIFCQKN